MLKLTIVLIALCIFAIGECAPSKFRFSKEQIETYQKMYNTSLATIQEQQRSKRQVYYYDPWYSSYWYHYYNYYPTLWVQSSCGYYSCPSQCPGTCGTYSGLFACKCSSCYTVSDPCNYGNIARGYYLHPFPLDATKYIQCDSSPGVFYVRNCAPGLVFDARFSVCNYAPGWRG